MENNNRDSAKFSEMLAEIWRLPPTQTPAEWVQDNIYLPARVTPYPGKISFARSPYWIEPLNHMAHTSVEDIVIVSGSQLGKTTLMQCAILWGLKFLQMPTLIVMPSESMCRSFSESRLQPTIEESEAMRDLKPSSVYKYKLLEMHFKTATLNLVGANSPSNLSSRPVGLLALDETDKYPEKTKDEAAAIFLAMQRTKEYPLRKHIITSTPTTAGKAIWEYYLQGDQRHYWMPSPADPKKEMWLGELPLYEEIRTKSGRLDIERTSRTARVLCPWTGKKIFDSDKPEMLRKGRWKPDVEGYTGITRSYQISSLYSLTMTWQQIVLKYLLEKTKPYGTQNFQNSWLAIPYDPSTDQTIKEVPTGGYPKNHDHGEEQIRVMAVDVQLNHFWFVIRAVVDDKLVLIDEGKLSTYEDIEETREKQNVPPDLVGIDCGYNTEIVKAQAAKYGWVCLLGVTDRGYYWRQDEGSERVKRISSPPNPEPAYHSGGQLVPVIQWASQRGQDLLHFAQSEGIWTAATDVSPDYMEQMRSHKLSEKIKKGKSVYLWERIGRTPDHLWDCESMACVLIDALDMMPCTMEVSQQIDLEV